MYRKNIFIQIIVLLLSISLISASLISAVTNDNKILGSPDATLTVEIYTDFQDPFSERWYQQTLPELENEYMNDEKINIIFRHFPLNFHKDAMNRSKAAECSAEQGYFSDFVEKLYTKSDDMRDDEGMDYYRDLGEEIVGGDFDFEEFELCFYNIETEEKIEYDFDKGQIRGVRGTPAFFINDQLLSGAQPFSVFKEVIDIALGIKNNDSIDRYDNAEDMQSEPIKIDNEKKKIHIIGYMEYNDPFSKRSWETIKKLFIEYDDDLSFEFRNFPHSFQDEEYLAAQAGECVYSIAGNQIFFKYTDKLMEIKYTDGSMVNENNDTSFLISQAKNLGIDSNEIEKCLTDRYFLPEVLDDLNKGERDNVRGTPKFIINGQIVNGAQPYHIFEEIIEDELEELSDDGDDDDNNEDTPDVPEEIICLSGCKLDEICVPLGERLNYEDVDVYCSLLTNFESQKLEGESCQNNYECFSNQCSNKECIDLQKELKETQNLLQKFFRWFGRFFGRR